jgi:hypothetical protein
VCSPATQTCERHAVDGGRDASPDVAIDAPADAPVDAPPDAPAPTAQLVQQNVGYQATAAQLSITLANLPASGDVLVFVGGCPQSRLDGVTGAGIATWTRGTYSDVNANVEIWYGVTDGTNATVTASLATCQGPFWGAVTEWSGLTAAPADGGHAFDGTTSPADPGPVTTTHAHDLLIFGVADTAPNTFGTPAPGTWIPLQNPNSMFVKQGSWYQIVSAAGAYDPHVPETSHDWDAALLALKIAP